MELRTVVPVDEPLRWTWLRPVLPEPSRFMIVDGVLEEVAAFAANSAEWTLADVEPPTLLTVAAADPGPVAETSEVRALMKLPVDCLALNVAQSVEVK